MKREDISKVFEGATDEQISRILDINSADIGKAKGDYETLKNDLKTANETITRITGELDGLKQMGATAEDWKAKFETLQADIAEKEKTAAAEKLAAEKAENIKSRFEAALLNEKGTAPEFAHEAIKASYLAKFGEALNSNENTGKSDKDILFALTKDDAAAFKVATPVVLAGARPMTGIGDITKEAFSKMGYADRFKLKTEQPDIYQAMTSKGD